MTIQVDVWCGELHQKHGSSRNFERWEDAAAFIGEMIETGFLCNVLHTDFKAPPERVAEAERALAKLLSR